MSLKKFTPTPGRLRSPPGLKSASFSGSPQALRWGDDDEQPTGEEFAQRNKIKESEGGDDVANIKSRSPSKNSSEGALKEEIDRLKDECKELREKYQRDMKLKENELSQNQLMLQQLREEIKSLRQIGESTESPTKPKGDEDPTEALRAKLEKVIAEKEKLIESLEKEASKLRAELGKQHEITGGIENLKDQVVQLEQQLEIAKLELQASQLERQRAEDEAKRAWAEVAQQKDLIKQNQNEDHIITIFHDSKQVESGKGKITSSTGEIHSNDIEHEFSHAPVSGYYKLENAPKGTVSPQKLINVAKENSLKNTAEEATPLLPKAENKKKEGCCSCCCTIL